MAEDGLRMFVPDPTLFKDLKLLSVKGIRNAMTQSRKRAVTAMLNEAADQVAKKLNAQKGSIKEAMGSLRDPKRIGIKVRRHGIPLGKFNNRGTPKVSGRKGVSVRIKKGGPLKVVKHGFVATMESGHTGVMKRAPYKWNKAKPKRKFTQPRQRGKLAPRSPINEMYSKGALATIIDIPGVNDPIQEAGMDMFQVRFRSQIDRFLKRRKTVAKRRP